MVDIGAYGSQSDGGILAESPFGKLLVSNNLPLPFPTRLPKSNEIYPYFFVGDNAFPLHCNLMRPYTERNALTSQERNFNKKIARARVTVENTFGILATRWRVLQNVIHAWPDNVDRIIKATVLLHNFSMQKKCVVYCPANYADRVVNNEIVPGQWRNDSENNSFINLSASRAHNASKQAYNLRTKLSNYLYNNI